MADVLKTLIADLLAMKPGEEFALSFDDGTWSVDFVHPGHHGVMLEFGGVYRGAGDTPEEAVQSCIDQVRQHPALDQPQDTRTEAEKAFDAMVDDLSAEELRHFCSARQDAFPGEWVPGFVRARDIVASCIMAPKIPIVMGTTSRPG